MSTSLIIIINEHQPEFQQPRKIHQNTLSWNVPSGKLTQLWEIATFSGQTHYRWAIVNSHVVLLDGNL